MSRMHDIAIMRFITRFVVFAVLGLCSAAHSSQTAFETYVEFEVSGTSHRYSQLYAAQILDRRANTIDVILGPGRGLLDKGPIYSLSWTISSATPPHEGIVTSRVMLALDVPGTQQYLTSFGQDAIVLVTLTAVTEEVIEGTFTAERLQLVSKNGSKREIKPGEYSVTGRFRARRTYAELDG